MTQIPSLGRIVHYSVTRQQAEEINRRRTSATSIAERIKVLAWPLGAQAHIGNPVSEGDVFPMTIVRVWGDDPTSCVSGQVQLDGTDVLWATSVSVGTGPGHFLWPVVR